MMAKDAVPHPPTILLLTICMPEICCPRVVRKLGGLPCHRNKFTKTVKADGE
jgi:hypothetical protein